MGILLGSSRTSQIDEVEESELEEARAVEVDLTRVGRKASPI